MTMSSATNKGPSQKFAEACETKSVQTHALRFALRCETPSPQTGGGGLDRNRKASFKKKKKKKSCVGVDCARAANRLDRHGVRSRGVHCEGCGGQVHRMPCEGRQHAVDLQRQTSSGGVPPNCGRHLSRFDAESKTC